MAKTKYIDGDPDGWDDLKAYRHPDGGYWLIDFEEHPFSVSIQSAKRIVKLLTAIIKEEEK